jgi:hypothetical protein
MLVMRMLRSDRRILRLKEAIYRKSASIATAPMNLIRFCNVEWCECEASSPAPVRVVTGPPARKFKGQEMKIVFPVVLASAMALSSPTRLLAEAPAKTFEATKTIGAGSLNPPNPGEACKDAKKNTIEKAASAGFKGKVVWDKLSADSDCKLSTSHVGHIGYYYTFTAKGTFSQTGLQEPLDPQKDHKEKFKAGCKSSNGSWIENADGSYQCNARSGETTKCFKDTPATPCTHIK